MNRYDCKKKMTRKPREEGPKAKCEVRRSSSQDGRLQVTMHRIRTGKDFMKLKVFITCVNLTLTFLVIFV